MEQNKIKENGKTNVFNEKTSSFVFKTISECERNKEVSSNLKKMESQSTEHYAWGYLVSCGVNLQNETEKSSYALIGSSIAKHKVRKNGNQNVSSALLKCYGGEADSGPAQARMRRILSCDNTKELCSVLRPVISLIYSKSIGDPQIDYVQLLKDLIFFEVNQDLIKSKWAQSFYSKRTNKDSVSACENNDGALP